MAKFPGHLMNVAHKLDLSANQIRSLPWSTLKKVREDAREGGRKGRGRVSRERGRERKGMGERPLGQPDGQVPRTLHERRPQAGP